MGRILLAQQEEGIWRAAHIGLEAESGWRCGTGPGRTGLGGGGPWRRRDRGALARSSSSPRCKTSRRCGSPKRAAWDEAEAGDRSGRRIRGGGRQIRRIRTTPEAGRQRGTPSGGAVYDQRERERASYKGRRNRNGGREELAAGNATWATSRSKGRRRCGGLRWPAGLAGASSGGLPPDPDRIEEVQRERVGTDSGSGADGLPGPRSGFRGPCARWETRARGWRLRWWRGWWLRAKWRRGSGEEGLGIRVSENGGVGCPYIVGGGDRGLFGALRSRSDGSEMCNN